MSQVVRCLRDQVNAAALLRTWAARMYAAQAAPAPGKDDSMTAVEAIQTNEALLVQLKHRAHSPLLSLPQSTVQEWSQLLGNDGPLPEQIGVVRDAFTPHSNAQRPLSHLLKSTSPSTVAASTALCRAPTRAIVDVYTFAGTEDNSYELVVPALDMMSFLWGQEMRVTLTAGDVRKKDTLPAHYAKQSSNEVLMVAPTAFGFNEQTAQDNHFMHAAAQPGESEDLVDTVTREFAGLHHVLSEVHGVHVHLMQHSLAHGTPDAVFPNNWFSTHSKAEALGDTGGDTMVLYPMKCPNRAAERRPELIKLLNMRDYDRTVDMSKLEAEKRYFEGTGVLVIDRIRGVAYVSISERADKEAAQQWADKLGYRKLITFASVDSNNQTIYHTNVMMAIGTGVAVVCGESIADAAQRKEVFDELSKTHEVVDISLKQMDSFCGNVLEVEDGRGLPVMAMSTQAYHAFTEDQRQTILRHCADIAHAPVDTIERIGGGGVRCMIAELFNSSEEPSSST